MGRQPGLSCCQPAQPQSCSLPLLNVDGGEASVSMTNLSGYPQAHSHGEGFRARAGEVAQCWEQAAASQESCGGVSVLEVCWVWGMCLARGGGRQERGWQLAHSHSPGVSPHRAFSCSWQSQGSTEGPSRPSCWLLQAKPRAAALPALRNVIHGMEMQHDVLVLYNPLNPSQTSALWGFRCK